MIHSACVGCDKLQRVLQKSAKCTAHAVVSCRRQVQRKSLQLVGVTGALPPDLTSISSGGLLWETGGTYLCVPELAVALWFACFARV
eukprot:584428-Amphidinium_carterae.1